MIEFNNEAWAEMENDKLIADDIIGEWEGQVGLALEEDKLPNLETMIKDKLASEGDTRRKPEMLQLVQALTERMDKIILPDNEFNQGEVSAAMKLLGEKSKEYQVE